MFGIGDISKPENTSSHRCLHKARAPAPFLRSPGLACAVPGPGDQPCAANPVMLNLAPPWGVLPPTPARLLPAGRGGEAAATGRSVPSASCPAPCELVNSRRHGCSPLWERAETLLNHLAGIHVLTAAPGPCRCAQTPDPTRQLHLGCQIRPRAAPSLLPPPSAPCRSWGPLRHKTHKSTTLDEPFGFIQA